VLALMGAPLMKILAKIKIRKKSIPDAITALFTLLFMYSLVFYLCVKFVPLMVTEVQFLTTLNFNQVFHSIWEEFPAIKNFGTEELVKTTITTQANGLLDFKNVSGLLNNAASIVGSFAGGLLAVSFITYFLLKEETMVYKTVLLITPSQFESEIKDILRTTRAMLTKYFIGLFCDMVIVSTIVASGMYFCGVKNAVFIGVFAGVMNIIPYIGPLISLVFAMFLGVTGCFEYGTIHDISGVVTKIFFVMLAVNLLDGILIQPFIFSKSVQAHPLEIFLVILMAATLGGIVGMVIAIPTYTLMRIVAKEFLTNLKFFKKITENIPE
jgi:predicted PurR-regulated permease PerM